MGGGDKVKILVACEESQRVTAELRRLGHEAYSCDIQATSGDHPEWHLQQDVTPLLVQRWDAIIAFPPCTDLCCACSRLWKQKQADGRQKKSIEFFMSFVEANCPKIVVENPVGIMSTVYRRPDQIIQPWQFGDPYTKKTCLWLKGLPLLNPTKKVESGEKYSNGTPKWYNLGGKNRAKMRSKTFPGIAKAMAEQWFGRMEK